MRTDHQILVAGGGPAALETVLALREHAPGLGVTMLTGEPQLVYRPLSVAEPFGRGETRRFDLREIADDLRIGLVVDRLLRVSPDTHAVVTAGGHELGYESLVVAVGARAVAPFDDALTFRGDADVAALREVLDAVAEGWVTSVAFVVPEATTWALPAYELAVQTAALAAEHRREAKITVVTPERAPLALFGEHASAALSDLLAARGVSVRSEARARAVEAGRLLLAGGASVAAEQVVTLPVWMGPGIDGLPADAAGFVPVDAHGRVEGVDDIYAAGDATTFPLKQGGIATQQADAVAAAIAAADQGTPDAAPPFRPVLRGLLLTAGAPLYLRAEPGGQTEPTVAAEAAGLRAGRTISQAATAALWWPPSKIAGRYVGPYLATARPSPLRPQQDRTAPELQAPPEDVAAALDLTLLLADEDARWGEYRLALRSLDAAETIAGALPPEYATKRERWSRILAGERDPFETH